MIEKHHFSFPIVWDLCWIEKILKKDSTFLITDFYGTLERDPFGSGRVKYFDSIPDEKQELIVQLIHQNGRKFRYLLNAPISEPIKWDSRHHNLLNWIRDTLKADALVITSPLLMKLCRQIVPELPIQISTIAGVKTPEDLKPFLEFQPESLVPHHDLPREPESLKNLHEYCMRFDITLELMVTESCLYKCSRRDEHYNSIVATKNDIEFHLFCQAARKSDPAKLFSSGSFIRPEDIDLYVEHFGIKKFKITGRSRPPSSLFNCCQAYLSGRSPENLIMLMGMDPRIQGEKWIRIAPEAFNGMLEEILINLKSNVEIAQLWYKNALAKNQFEIIDNRFSTNESFFHEK